MNGANNLYYCNSHFVFSLIFPFVMILFVSEEANMRQDELSRQSMDFAVMIIDLVRTLKAKHETVISNQIGRSGTSIGANIREAQYNDRLFCNERIWRIQ